MSNLAAIVDILQCGAIVLVAITLLRCASHPLPGLRDAAILVEAIVNTKAPALVSV